MTPTASPSAVDIELLREIERRVLWFSVAIVHHANRVRPNRSGMKVGGHQASSASIVSIMTALWFSFLRAPDRISVKPHASPVLHAINYLLGRLPADYLPRFREFGGLQSYPSRTKDPDDVDYSTGSVGIGATATIWGALAHRYLAGHFEVTVGGRQIALVGDAELDEGAVWEAILDPMARELGEVLWIVDVNRQSLDRVVPEIAADRLRSMFEAAGWHTITLKYGRRLEALFERSGGRELRRRIDDMSNAEYQSLLRASAEGLRTSLPAGRGAKRLASLVAELSDHELSAAIRDLGGHDLETLIDGLAEADSARTQPCVVFAYTIKGRHLPVEGHPANHSALLNDEQFQTLAESLGAETSDPWALPEPGSAAADLCERRADELRRSPRPIASSPSVPSEFGRPHHGEASTQQALGRFFSDLSRDAPEVAKRVVTVSPDVASSTNLGGWINRAGIWSIGDRIDWFAEDSETLVRWRETSHGQHIELGIAETNLVGLLGELGATWRVEGEPLLPIGTLYDPFVGRALEPWSFGIYSGGQSILIGTPSGISLAPEGGAHQSDRHASDRRGTAGLRLLGTGLRSGFRMELPECPQFVGSSRRNVQLLSTFYPADPAGAFASNREPKRARTATASGSRRRLSPQDGPDAPTGIALVGMGAVMPEVIGAADELGDAGIACDVVCVTSADLLFRSARSLRGFGPGDGSALAELLPRDWPIVTVLDGHPSALSFLATARGVPSTALGVVEFGQSGDIASLYEHHSVDSESIVGAALDLLDQ